jgi:diguanylate cyclase (GGDEF)-like protein
VSTLFLAYPSLAELPDFRAVLDEAREISYQQHWGEAQDLLDEISATIDQAPLREYADYQLLQARHLVLNDRTEESVVLVDALLERDLAPDQRLRALQFRANAGVLLRQYESAFASLSEALSIDIDLDDPAPVVATLNMAAYMLGRVGEYALGIEYGERSLAMARDANRLDDACVALQRLAPVYKWAGRTAEAEQAYRTGIRDCQIVGNSLFVGVFKYGLADLLRRDGRPADALRLVEQSIEMLEQAVYVLGEFEARLVRAEILQDLGELDESWRGELDRIGDYFSARTVSDQLARLEFLMSERAEESGDFERALERIRRYIEARESFLGRERAMRLAYLQVEFDSRIQRQQIELLRETARVAQLEAQAASQQRRLRTVGWLLVGLLVLSLSGLLFRVFRSRREFRELSRHDRLSGLANHAWFFEQAQSLLDKIGVDKARHPEVVLIAADVDFFKQINDAFGHRVGDNVLGRIGRCLREAFPPGALVGRIGGEEFAVLMADGGVEQALTCIERFREIDARMTRQADPDVTLSFGLSCLRPGDTIDTLRDRADQALYRAKESGRNRYELDDSCFAEGLRTS